MTKKILFNAFEMNCVAHQSPGLWKLPNDRSWQYKDLDYWTDLAKILEKGIFTAIFIADVIGYYDVFQGSINEALKGAVQIPVNDPIQLAAPIAQATEHIGIGITASTSFEHPYTFARRIATADHLTKGRVGWNIVTSYLESGAKNIGLNGLASHDDRYAIADEYLEVIYKLLEGSWQNGSVIRDKESGVFIDSNKVVPINHQGKFFNVPGFGLTEPSPQRTPVLFQAGSSQAGTLFASQHAECVFVSSPKKATIKRYVAKVRELAVKEGRKADDVKVFNLATIIVEETDEQAQKKYEEYKQYQSIEGALVLLSGWSGIDFSQFDLDSTIKATKTNAIISLVEHLTDHGENWTIRELANWAAIGGMGPVFVGSAKTIADELLAWASETDVDGFNLTYVVAHETFEKVVELLVPELQRRDAYPLSYAKGSLRNKIFGKGDYLPENHPANSYRNLSEGNT